MANSEFKNQSTLKSIVKNFIFQMFPNDFFCSNEHKNHLWIRDRAWNFVSLLLSRIHQISSLFHQSRIPKLFQKRGHYSRGTLFKDIRYLFLNFQTEKKSCFGPIRSFFLFQLLKMRNICGEKLAKKIGENISWIRY